MMLPSNLVWKVQQFGVKFVRQTWKRDSGLFADAPIIGYQFEQSFGLGKAVKVTLIGICWRYQTWASAHGDGLGAEKHNQAVALYLILPKLPAFRIPTITYMNHCYHV
jgi:hypothetical protein